MKPDARFQHKPQAFWASVRTLSQHLGYSRGNTILSPKPIQMASAFEELGLKATKLINGGKPTKLAGELEEYFAYRARSLMHHIEPRLMDAARAKKLFEEMRTKFLPACPLPMNKQKGDKRAEAFLTCIVNMLIESNCDGMPCDYDPRELTTITRDGEPIRTLARRVDGAFPSTINPIAIWEIKEYYYTTTFGSRVADGVYETLLDGMEIEELRKNEGVDVKHYLMVDAHFTWWDCGKAYLCRIVDMLHMGYVDEALFGFEVVEELPRIVKEWVKRARTSASDKPPDKPVILRG